MSRECAMREAARRDRRAGSVLLEDRDRNVQEWAPYAGRLAPAVRDVVEAAVAEAAVLGCDVHYRLRRGFVSLELRPSPGPTVRILEWP